MSRRTPKYDWGLNWPDAERAAPFTRTLAAIGTIVGGVALIVGVVATFWVFWRFIEALASGDDEAIRNVGLIFLAVFGAPFVIWRAIVAQGNLDRSRERDYADLFTKSVEQLGATREVKVWQNIFDEDEQKTVLREVVEQKSNIEVRIGALYALRKIGIEAPTFHDASLNTVCDYIRENLPKKREKDFDKLERMSNDMRTAFFNVSKFGFRNSQNMANLRFVDLSFYQLGSIDLSYCDLEQAIISRSDLTGANLRYSNMRGVLLIGAHLNCAEVHGANFSNANLLGANGLTEDHLLSSFGSKETKLPEYAERWRPSHWEDSGSNFMENREKYCSWLKCKNF